MATVKWWSGLWSEDSKVNTEALHNIQMLGVKMVAFDFDLTLMDFTVHQDYEGSMEELARHFRPCFKSLITAALQSSSVNVCVVSWNITGKLIHKLLKFVFASCDTSKILIQDNPSPSPFFLFSVNLFKNGKEPHLKIITQKHQIIHQHRLKASEILLFDDVELFVKIAKKNGHFGFHVKENVTSEKILKKLRAMVEERGVGV